jgi:GNAT superfamily N-acetyltransferase
MSQLNKVKYFHFLLKMRITQKKIGDDTFIYFVNHQNNELDYGYIQYYISNDENIVNLLYIYVHPDLRGQRYGEYLIKEMFKDVTFKMKAKGVEQFDILLDDMSDHFGKDENLYRKMGFEYCEIDEEGPCGPEMSLTIKIKN